MARLDKIAEVEQVFNRDLLVLIGRARTGDGADKDVSVADAAFRLGLVVIGLVGGVGKRIRKQAPGWTAALRALRLRHHLDANRVGLVRLAFGRYGGAQDTRGALPDRAIAPLKRDALLHHAIDERDVALGAGDGLEQHQPLGLGWLRRLDVRE